MIYRLASAKRSASVTAAAIMAILGSLVLLLVSSAEFFLIVFYKMPHPSADLPPFLRTFILAVQGFLMCAAIYGIAMGVGLIYLRNWARISILVWGGLAVFFGFMGMALLLLLHHLPNPAGSPLDVEGTPEFILAMLLIYGVPLVMGVWWLILFTRKSVKSQFIESAPLLVPGELPKPACPLPISVIAWFYITSILNLLIFPFLPSRFPVFLFGWALPGSSGTVVLTLTLLALAVGGIGLLQLKPWSYTLTMSLQAFWLVNTGVSMLTPGYKADMDAYILKMQTSMNLPVSLLSLPSIYRSFSAGMTIGLLGGVVILGLLIYYRSRFLENAARAVSAT